MRSPFLVLPALALSVAAVAGCSSSAGGPAPSATSASALVTAVPSEPGSSSSASSASSDSSGGSQAAAADGIPCGPEIAGTAEMPLPDNVPPVPGGTVYLSKGPFGSTALWFEAVEADPTDLDSARDLAAQQLVDAGYTLDRSDQEEGSEAEAVLSGPHDVSIQVIQLCEGHVRVKYRVEG